ncbi:MAG: PA4780 family RIO1-like protein kinase [Gammaproteobacteria bacterium]
MKIPESLQPLIEDGVIDEVIRSLRSGKEASIYIVRCGTAMRCAKVYKDLRQRSFQQRAQYQEGRRVRSSRQARAMGRSTSFGRKAQETAWKSAEVDALQHLAAAGVRVPATYGFFNGVLLMELITDADDEIAPDLGEVEHSPAQARAFHQFLVGQIVRMLCAGLVHGDLSEYNVLVGADGPVIIDLPQVVSATGNNNARAMLLRDVNNITATLGRAAPELLATRFGEEMWERFERGALEPDSVLSGEFVEDDSAADVAGTLLAIEDAREEALRRQAGREAAEQPDSAQAGNDAEPDPRDFE